MPLPETRAQHDKIAKEYAENRKKKAELYHKLFYTSIMSLLFIMMDFVTGITTITFRMVFLIVFSIFFFWYVDVFFMGPCLLMNFVQKIS